MIIARYHEYFGRMGALEYTFACEPVEIEGLKAWGEYYHGEVLGKHSDITGEFNDETIKILVDDDPTFVARCVDLKIVESRCPFRHLIAEMVSDDGDGRERLRAIGHEKFGALVELWGLDA